MNYENIESWDTDELLEEYESLIGFRAIESYKGQVSVGEIRRLKLVREEVCRRL